VDDATVISSQLIRNATASSNLTVYHSGRKLLATKSLGGQSLATESFDSQGITRELQALTGMIAKAAGRAMQERLAKSGIDLSPMQLGALRMLAMQPHTISELSKMFVLDPSTLVPVVDGLEARGLVERHKDPNDRRRVPIMVTSAGEHAVARMMELDGNNALLQAVEQLGHERALLLRDLLRDLLLALPDGKEALCGMQDLLDRMQNSRPATPASPPS
jgi:DNA-binding MarR family transcriptional regulator